MVGTGAGTADPAAGRRQVLSPSGTADPANRDPLTGLPDERLLRFRGEQAASLARRHAHQVGLLRLSLEGLESAAGELGPAAGDRLLRRAAGRLRSRIRESDTAVRLGGHEFAVLFARVEGEAEAVAAARRVLEGLRSSFFVDGREVRLSSRAGLSLHPRYASDFEALWRQAARALRTAGGTSRREVSVYRPEWTVAPPRRRLLLQELHRALRHYRLRLVYQPVRAPDGGRIRGGAARVRWPHPRLGSLTAAKFLPLAEEAGLLQRLDRWVLARAAVRLRDWARDGFRGWIAVHLSEATLRGPGLADDVAVGLAPLEGLDPARLVVRLPAAARLDDGMLETGRALARMGPTVWLSGFAPGRTPLDGLRALEPDLIGLDRGLLQGVVPGSRDERLLRVTVDAARTLGAKTIATGVERPRDRSLARRSGCDLAEGYLLGWPVPADEFPAEEG